MQKHSDVKMHLVTDMYYCIGIPISLHFNPQEQPKQKEQ